MSVVFTERWLRGLKPSPDRKPKQFWDRACPNLGLRLSGTTGSINFYVVRRVGKNATGKNTAARWIRIGRWPIVELEAAREQALALVRQISAGKDPRQTAAAQKLAEEAAHEAEAKAVKTFGGVAEAYIEYLEGGTLRTKDILVTRIRREFREWYGLPLAEINHTKIVGFITDIRKRGNGQTNGKKRVGGPHPARHTWVLLRQICVWAVVNDYLDTDPCAKIRKPQLLHGLKKEDLERDRFLDDRELRLVWHAADAVGYPFGSLVKLLLLTGCRLRECSNLRWSEVDTIKSEIVIPAERVKIKKAHVVPLSSVAGELMETLPTFLNCDYVFTNQGRTPIIGFTHPKRRLEELLGDQVAPFTLHDLRRSVRTGLASIPSVKSEVAEAILGHTIKGVEGVYNRYDYVGEKRAGLEAWAQKLLSIVEPPPKNVAPEPQHAQL